MPFPKGTKFSEEHKRQISESLKKYAKKPGNHLEQLHKKGEEHPNFRGGIKPEYYRRIAFEHYGKQCDTCGTSEGWIIVHHKDQNRRNNDIDNLQVLCASCHLKLHHQLRKAEVG